MYPVVFTVEDLTHAVVLQQGQITLALGEYYTAFYIYCCETVK